MDSSHNISDAGLYTDFSGLQKLRAKASGPEDTVQSREATKEVAKQFESLFLQMMLKTMRDATVTGESAESDQTRFYQEMFDKQIALDLADNSSGGGLGIAKLLEQDLSGGIPKQGSTANDSKYELIRNQINRSAQSVDNKQGSGQE